MESFLNRYRNITVLLLVILAQLVLLSVQVKNDQDVRFIRVWTVTAVTPMAKVVDTLRGSTIGVVRNYIRLHDADSENRRLQKRVDQLQLDNAFLKNELATAERAKALQVFQARVPSKTLPARIFFQGLGTASMVYADRGSLSGVMRGMGVITPDGILGKVVAAYPTTSEILLVSDPEFAAGVVSTKSQARGTLKGQGADRLCKVDYVAFADKVEPGDWFYTSGEDRIFPSGFAVGVVKYVKLGQPYKEVAIEPSGLWRGLEDVLIVLESVHQPIPAAPPSQQPVYLGPPPPGTVPAAGSAGAQATPAVGPDGTPVSAPAPPPVGGTDADKLKTLYKNAGDAQGHTFGEGLPHGKPPDFTNLPGGGVGPPGGTAPPRAAPPPANKGTAKPVAPSDSNPPATKGTSSPDGSRRANQAAGSGGGR